MAEYTPIELTRAGRRLDMAFAGMHLEISGRMDITQAELLAIAWLGMEGDLGPTELAHRLHMRTGAVTALLDRLEQRGHIVRAPHPADRRKVVVHLTENGREDTMVHMGPMVAEVMELARRTPAEDREHIGRFMDELAQIAQRYATDRPPAA
jgi:DNA-binding MarR family transcriptional regulator